MAAAAAIDISVMEITGRFLTLNVDPGDTVNEIKEMIADKEGVPMHQQRLSLPGESTTPLALEGAWGSFTLAELDIGQGTTVLLWRDPAAVEPTANPPPMSLPPSQTGPALLLTSGLWYTHEPSQQFRDGRRVAATALELIRDPSKVLPLMKVVDFAGITWCRSNRRLLAYRVAGILVLTEGVHFRRAPVDRHFVSGLSLASVELVQRRHRAAPFDVEPMIWRELLARYALELERERARLARRRARP